MLLPHSLRSPGAVVCVGLLVMTPLAGGCSGSAATAASEPGAHNHEHEHDHDHESRPESLSAAFTQLVVYRDAIQTAIDSGNPSAAHAPLHEVAELLEVVPDIAAATDLPKPDWDAVKAASDRLFDSFGVVDKAFHRKDGDKKAAYKEVADDINQSLEEIKKRLPLANEPTGDSHDDHAAEAEAPAP